jgi:hypothetical protein
MRQLLAPVLVAGLLLAAGLGLTSTVVPVLRSWRRAVAAAGLAYLIGVAAVASVDIALLTAGVRLGLTAFTVTCLALAIGGASLGWRFGPPVPDGRHATPRSRLDAVIAPVLGGMFAAFAVVALLRYVGAPLDTWDAWSIWTRKAIVLLNSGSLDPRLFTAPQYGFIHQDYPLLVPVLEAIHFRAVGGLNTQSVHFVFWTMLAAFPWALAYLAARGGRPVIWAPLVLAAATVPAFLTGMVTAYADVPLAIFLATGVLALGYWVETLARADLAVATVLLAGAASTKNEGLVGSVLAFVIAGLVLVRHVPRRRLVDLAVAAAAFVVAAAPWRIWVAANGIEGDVSLGKALNPGYLLDRADRIWPSIDALYYQLQDQGSWLYVLPLALIVLAAVIGFRLGRRPAAFYLLTGATFFVALVWVYWSAPYDIHWYLGTSAYRVVGGIAAIAIAALLHLTPRLVDVSVEATAAGDAMATRTQDRVSAPVFERS